MGKMKISVDAEVDGKTSTLTFEWEGAPRRLNHSCAPACAATCC
jgi:hypothetical protein